jgi:hypothetical protein
VCRNWISSPTPAAARTTNCLQTPPSRQAALRAITGAGFARGPELPARQQVTRRFRRSLLERIRGGAAHAEVAREERTTRHYCTGWKRLLHRGVRWRSEERVSSLPSSSRGRSPFTFLGNYTQVAGTRRPPRDGARALAGPPGKRSAWRRRRRVVRADLCERTDVALISLDKSPGPHRCGPMPERKGAM